MLSLSLSFLVFLDMFAGFQNRSYKENSAHVQTMMGCTLVMRIRMHSCKHTQPAGELMLIGPFQKQNRKCIQYQQCDVEGIQGVGLIHRLVYKQVFAAIFGVPRVFKRLRSSPFWSAMDMIALNIFLYI